MPSNTLKAMAQHLKLKVSTLERYYDEAKAQADKKFKKHDEHYYAYVMSIVRNRANARSKRNAAQASTVVATVINLANSTEEKLALAEFTKAGFKPAEVDGNHVVKYVASKQEMMHTMSELTATLRKVLGYTHVSVVDGIQYIFYPPSRKHSKIVVQLHGQESKVNEYVMYFE